MSVRSDDHYTVGVPGKTRQKPRRRPTISLSLRFPPDLRARVRRYARAHGLEEATAIRALCADRLREIELSEDLVAAERWQLEQAIASWTRLERGKLELASPAEVRRLFAEALHGGRRKPAGA